MCMRDPPQGRDQAQIAFARRDAAATTTWLGAPWSSDALDATVLLSAVPLQGLLSAPCFGCCAGAEASPSQLLKIIATSGRCGPLSPEILPCELFNTQSGSAPFGQVFYQAGSSLVRGGARPSFCSEVFDIPLRKLA